MDMVFSLRGQVLVIAVNASLTASNSATMRVIV